MRETTEIQSRECKGERAGEHEVAILAGDTCHWTTLTGRHCPVDV